MYVYGFRDNFFKYVIQGSSEPFARCVGQEGKEIISLKKLGNFKRSGDEKIGKRKNFRLMNEKMNKNSMKEKMTRKKLQ